MSTFNQVIVLGHVGSMTVKTVSNDIKVCNLSVATTQRAYTRKNGERVDEHTEWHNVVLWRNLANVCEQFVSKGSQVQVIGELRYRIWKDNEGLEHRVAEILANSIHLVGLKTTNKLVASTSATPTLTPPTPTTTQHQQPFDAEYKDDDDDLPF